MQTIALRTVVKRIRERQGTLLVGSAITIAFNGLSILLYGGGCVLAARALGPTEWGMALWFITGTTMVALFSDILGVYYANTYFVARGDDEFAPEVVRGSVLAYGLIVGGLVGALVVLIPPARHALFHGLYGPGWAFMVAANIAGLAFINQARGLMLGRSKFIAMGGVTLLKSGGFGILAIIFIFPFHLHTGLSIGFAHLLSTVAAAGASMQYCVRPGIAAPDLAYLRRCAAMGWRGFGVNLFSMGHQRLGQYLVNVELGSTALGLYGVVVSLGEVLTQVPAMVGLVLYPAAADPTNLRAVDRRATMLAIGTTLAMGVLMLPFVFIARPLVDLAFGAAYAPAVPVLSAFAPAVALLSGLLIVNQHISGTGYPVAQLVIMVVALGANALLNIILLPRMGVTGAAVATDISYALWLLLGLWYLRARWGARDPRGAVTT